MKCSRKLIYYTTNIWSPESRPAPAVTDLLQKLLQAHMTAPYLVLIGQEIFIQQTFWATIDHTLQCVFK